MAALNATDTQRLLELLQSDQAPISSLEEQLQELISRPGAGEPKVLAAIRTLQEFAFVAGTTATSMASLLIGGVFLQYLSDGKRAGGAPVASAAKAAVGCYLERLEQLLRDDARIEEEFRYKTTTTAVKKPQSARDAFDADTYRQHLLLKAVVFRSFLGVLDKSRKPRDLLCADRAAVDAEVESWATSKAALEEAARECKVHMDMEAGLSFGGGASKAVVLPVGRHPVTNPRDSVGLLPPVPRVLPPAPVVEATDLRPLVATTIGALLTFDAASHPAERRAVNDLLAQARTKELPVAQQQQLIAMLNQKSLSRCFSLSVPLWLDLTAVSPQVAVATIPRLSNPNVYLDALLALPGSAGVRRTSVLLAAAKLLQPHHLSHYVQGSVNLIRELRDDAAARNEAVVGFAVTLRQLCDKLTLSSADTEKVSAVFSEHQSLPEVSTLWGSLIK